MKRFEELFSDAVRAGSTIRRTPPPGECRSRSGVLCPLCFAGVLEYDQERAIRDRVMREWWHETLPDVPLAPLLASPRGRLYRSLSKRKVFRRGSVLTLGLIDPDSGDAERFHEIPRCAIEPSEHGLLYDVIGSWLKRPVANPLHDGLQYVIIKGDERERIVVLNVRSIDAPVVRTANALSKVITASDPHVRGVFLYEDASGGRYYLGTQSSGTPGRLQRLYGAGTLSHKTAGKRFVYPLLAFSQINQSMLDQLVLTVEELLGLPVQGTLFDLYCGYGLFGIALAEKVKRVTGVDISPAAIEAAVNIAQHLHVKNARFVRGALTAETLVPVMQRSGEQDCVLLDPPRGGTAEGVIEVIAGRRCRSVVHLFCNIDILPQEAQRWMGSGYRFERAVPLDMFPGTATVEIAGLFTPQQ